MTNFVATHWLSGLLAGIALILGLRLLLASKRDRVLSFPLLLWTCALGCLALGGIATAGVDHFNLLTNPALWGWWATGVALAVLFGALLLVVTTGRWSAGLGYTLGVVLLLGMGGVWSEAVGKCLLDGAKVVIRLEPLEPWWLLLLVLLPVIVLLGRRSLSGLGPVRRWTAIGLRCLLVLLLTLALAEVRLKHQNENTTVLFLVDRSVSIPEDFDSDDNSPVKRVDRRWERVLKFINGTVEGRGAGHKEDQTGVILFGRRPRVELPPSNSPRLNFQQASSNLDHNYTDISAAIKLALASFPEGTGKRIVLISDGNENLGNAEEQAQIAKRNGVQIDVRPLSYRNETEVLVSSVEAPSVTEQSSQLPLRVLIRNFNPRMVEGILTLNQVTEGQTIPVPPSPVRVQLRPGLNSIPFKKSLTKQQESYTYEAIFQPDAVVDVKGEPLAEASAALKAQDRVLNNRATTHVIALGQRRVLIIEPKAGDHEFLVEHLSKVGESKFTVHSISVDRLPENKADLAVLLSNYDCVILANVAASDVQAGNVAEEKPSAVITEDQQEVIRSNTHDQGCGLIMIGGPNGFGAGGWQGTPVEKALPVDCDIKSLKVQGKGGLVLIMHASEIEDGNRWQKDIAKLAIQKLSVLDMMGMIFYDHFVGGHRWHIPFQLVGEQRAKMLRLVDRMSPGDMPDVDPALTMAHDDLTNPKYELATRHIILISDGDHWNASPALLARLRANKITCTTVCITSHGALEEQKMSAVAVATGGRFYNVKSPKALPAIYIKETRLVSQSFIYEKRFQPRLVFKSGPTDKLPDDLQPLYGYVRTTPKVSPLVEMPIMAPSSGDQQFPILAYWHYGLGKAVAFTSDARSSAGRLSWDRDWAGSDMYAKFWEQVVDWSLRAVETGRLTMTTEYRDGKVKVVVDARDKNNRPLTDLTLRGGITIPAKDERSRPPELKFEQKNSGLYEAEFKAEEAGSYFINVQSKRGVKTIKGGKEIASEETDSVRSGVTIPYSPEFADMESNAPLLDKLRSISGGTTFPEFWYVLDKAAFQRLRDNGIPDDVVQKLQPLAGQKFTDENEFVKALAEPLDAGELSAHKAAILKDTRDGNGPINEAIQSKEVYRAGLPSSRSLQPVWYWLLLLTGLLLFFDVAVRRIALDPREVVVAPAQRLWDRLRGRAALAIATPQFLDRLKSRKAQVAETMERQRATRRFESEGTPAAPPPAGADEPAGGAARTAPLKPPPQRTIAPDAEKAAPVDYASRLLRAKKRVWEERDKDKDKDK